MKAVLDHVGIAVEELPAALAFFRDGLGLEVRATEEVASQGVRAHVLAAGAPSLELLEATDPASPIGRFLARRGPGLHHITLRVADVAATIAHLRARGVRLVDEQPRVGAEGALVAFVHPSSAHGVLVELTQPPPAARGTAAAAPPLARRWRLGALDLISLSDGHIRLDGGAMFGVVPRTLWQRSASPDDRNRIRLGLRPLVIRGSRTMLVDAGVGDKMSPRLADIYGFERDRHLEHALAEAGLTVEDIDVVLATHLHFDHAGGFTVRDAGGVVRPRFPRARYVIRRGEWEEAAAPNARTRASYVADDFLPLAEAGVVDFLEADGEVMPGVRVRRTGGHTRHHQIVEIESQGEAAVFAADLVPTTAHLPDPWIMGYDLFPLETLDRKQAFFRDVSARRRLVFFEHDPAIAAGYLQEQGGRRTVEPVL